MTWLNSNGGAITALATVALMVLTGVYVAFTLSMVRQNRAIWEETAKPLITVRPIIDPDFFQTFDLMIENVGGGPAQNLQLRVANPPLAEPVEHLADNGVFKNGIALLNAHEKIHFFLTDAIAGFAKVRDHPIQIGAEYKDRFGNAYEGHFLVDFREFENFTRVGAPPLVEMAHSIQDIRDEIRRIANGTKLRVVASTPEDDKREGRVTRRWAMLSQLDRVDPSGSEEIENLIKAKLSK